jgi:hypothetical protein
MGTIIVVLLAITMAILPISMPQAAMAAAHGHTTAVDAGHDHEHASLDGDPDHAHVQASSVDTASVDLDDHDGNSDDCTGPVCCSMGTCHAVQASAPPDVYSPNASRTPMIMGGDEQVGGITAGGLDRPPRTV